MGMTRVKAVDDGKLGIAENLSENIYRLAASLTVIKEFVLTQQKGRHAVENTVELQKREEPLDPRNVLETIFNE